MLIAYYSGTMAQRCERETKTGSRHPARLGPITVTTTTPGQKSKVMGNITKCYEELQTPDPVEIATTKPGGYLHLTAGERKFKRRRNANFCIQLATIIYISDANVPIKG